MTVIQMIKGRCSAARLPSFMWIRDGGVGWHGSGVLWGRQSRAVRDLLHMPLA